MSGLSFYHTELTEIPRGAFRLLKKSGGGYIVASKNSKLRSKCVLFTQLMASHNYTAKSTVPSEVVFDFDSRVHVLLTVYLIPPWGWPDRNMSRRWPAPKTIGEFT